MTVLLEAPASPHRPVVLTIQGSPRAYYARYLVAPKEFPLGNPALDCVDSPSFSSGPPVGFGDAAGTEDCDATAWEDCCGIYERELGQRYGLTPGGGSRLLWAREARALCLESRYPPPSGPTPSTTVLGGSLRWLAHKIEVWAFLGALEIIAMVPVMQRWAAAIFDASSRFRKLGPEGHTWADRCNAFAPNLSPTRRRRGRGSVDFDLSLPPITPEVGFGWAAEASQAATKITRQAAQQRAKDWRAFVQDHSENGAGALHRIVKKTEAWEPPAAHSSDMLSTFVSPTALPGVGRWLS